MMKRVWHRQASLASARDRQDGRPIILAIPSPARLRHVDLLDGAKDVCIEREGLRQIFDDDARKRGPFCYVQTSTALPSPPLGGDTPSLQSLRLAWT